MTPYGVIADLARDVLGLAEDAEPHEVERRIDPRAAAVLPRAGRRPSRARRAARCRSSAMLLGARRRGVPGGEIAAETRRQLLMKLLLRIESRLEGDQPVILVGEDIHWADQDSQELFAKLLEVRTPRPLFGLMTSRPEPRILKLAQELGTEIVHARRARRRCAPRADRRAVRRPARTSPI